MTNILKVLIGSNDTSLHDKARGLSKRVEVITRAQVETQPDLIAQIEVAYGGISPAQIAQAGQLKWLQTGGAGVNGLITPEIQASGLVITNASGIHAEPITEHMFGMLLMVTRRLAQAWDRQRTHQWNGEGLGDSVSLLAGKTLGLLGVGAIGGQSAQVGKAFGMRVLGLRRGGEPHPDVERMYTPDARRGFLAECDILMNTLPLTEKTRGFLGAEEFGVMKDGTIVINTGRGATIDTGAMMAALLAGRLGAALLDVTDPEPLPADHPLWTMENVYITPHYSGSHPGYGERADRIFLENLRRYLVGEPLVNVVDKQEGY